MKKEKESAHMVVKNLQKNKNVISYNDSSVFINANFQLKFKARSEFTFWKFYFLIPKLSF